jgi:hypothetical protein
MKTEYYSVKLWGREFVGAFRDRDALIYHIGNLYAMAFIKDLESFLVAGEISANDFRLLDSNMVSSEEKTIIETIFKSYIWLENGVKINEAKIFIIIAPK